MSALDDQRVHEYRQARQAAEKGLSAPLGSRERYQAAIVRYAECMAEITPDVPFVRRAMMCALYEDASLPLDVILGAYGATEDEAEYVKCHRQRRVA